MYAIEKYWADIVRSTDLDFFIYNIPSTTGYSLSPSLFQRMLSHPQVVGVKNSSAPVQDIYLLRAAQTRDTIIFNGVDEQYLGGRIMGADGGIGSTYGLMPKLYIELDKAFVKQDIRLAQKIQGDINEIIFKVLNCEGNLYDIMKKVLKYKDNLELGEVREPLPRASAEDEIVMGEIAVLIDEAEEKYCK
jgi:N-acetylneuraminate lyase